MSQHSTYSGLQDLFDEQMRAFVARSSDSAAASGRELKHRKMRLNQLRTALEFHRSAMQEALEADFGKPSHEVDATELAPVIVEINHALRNLGHWMKPERRPSPRFLPGLSTEVRFEPKGPSLIISPWNFVFNLTLGPLVHATAAGCPVMLKPSEHTPRASALISRIVESVYPPVEAAVIQGDADVARELLGLPFRHVYFTGSPEVGAKVMTAAAKHLASVTLELGGKSPAYVNKDANLELAARSIAFAKFVNAGQTCIAPDYVMVHSDVVDGFTAELIRAITTFFGPDPALSPDYARIIHQAHLNRLGSIVGEALEAGARVVAGGALEAGTRVVAGGALEAGTRVVAGGEPGSGATAETVATQSVATYSGATSSERPRYFPPTLLADVPTHCRLMQEEIFGPILPIVQVDGPNEALVQIRTLPPPLCAYVFTGSSRVTDQFSAEVRIGAVCENESLVQFANPFAPFGGLAQSGIGRSHGKAGFLEFTNEQTVVRRRFGGWVVRKLYPPYSGSTTRWVDRLLRWS